MARDNRGRKVEYHDSYHELQRLLMRRTYAKKKGYDQRVKELNKRIEKMRRKILGG